MRLIWGTWSGAIRAAMSASPIAAAAAATTFVAPLVLRPTSTAGISYLSQNNRFFSFSRDFEQAQRGKPSASSQDAGQFAKSIYYI
jgi:hypothetical protein